ncbi:hypothetical protein H072_182 [Dactylellina haptotyla CBS 200.50]|uniref:BTB domain-containing protein n=1 Tax=Dactylellina haptotyla (strain CBS 200.50) TaxID=1284197 RepID=S8ASC0_DACHA|nr:hypothetical protein H072_182 [Dactylellina haptotyla CBS 200.50]
MALSLAEHMRHINKLMSDVEKGDFKEGGENSSDHNLAVTNDDFGPIPTESPDTYNHPDGNKATQDFGNISQIHPDNAVGAREPPAKRLKTTIEQEPGQSRFSKLFNDPEFSDLQVTVGAGEQATVYHMHQAIVCASAGYIKRECQKQISTIGRKTINIPDIQPYTFAEIGMWIYDEHYYPNVSPNKTSELLEAAEYLEVKVFRETVLSMMMAKSGQYISGFCKLRRGNSSCVWALVEGTCNIARVTDWIEARKFVKTWLPDLKPPPAWILSLAKESKSGLLAALMLDCLTELVGTTMCHDCMHDNIENSIDCLVCGKGLYTDQWLAERDAFQGLITG